MKYVSLPILLLIAAQPLASAETPVLHLQAASTTAHAITGDVTLRDRSVMFGNGVSLTLQPAQGLFTDEGAPVPASLYRIMPPADAVLLNGNHLCGSSTHPAQARFMAVWKTEPVGADVDPRSIAVFSGPEQPSSTHAKDLCGIYNYEAGAGK